MIFVGAPLAVGVLLAWSLAVIPGPANALIATEASKRGLAAGFVTGLGAITADLTMFLLMWLGVVRLIDSLPWLRVVLGAVGAILLARFAWGAWWSAKEPMVEATTGGGYAKCYLVIATSPLNWAWWATAGTTIFSQFGLAVVVGFFAGLLAWVVVWTWLTREGARRIARFSEYVAYASAVLLAAFALVVAWSTVATAISLA